MTKNLLKNLLYLSNAAFLVLYLLLSWNNRLTADDFYFLNNIHQHGILKGTYTEYNAYSTRWLSVLVVHLVLSLIPYTKALFLYGLVSIGLVITAFYYFLKTSLFRFLRYQPSRLLLLNLAIFCTNALFYSSMNIGEVWFWLSASPTYLWSFSFFILGCGIVLSDNSYPILKFIFVFFSFLYIGGSAEAFASIVLMAIVVFIVWLVFFKASITDRKTYLSRLSVAFFACLLSLVILYMGHGNVVRLSYLNKISLFKALYLTIETTGWIGLHWLSQVLLYILLFSLPMIYAGNSFSKNNIINSGTKKMPITIFRIVVLYGVLLFILNYPATYLLAGIPPARALIAISFLTWALFAFIFFQAGYKISIKKSTTIKLAQVAMALCVVVNIYNIVQQYAVTGEYAKRYDALIEEFESKKENTAAIKFEPLPPSGMLKPLDVGTDSLTNNNIYIKKALGLKPYIFVSKN